MEAISPKEPPTYHFHVTAYESEEARTQAKLAVEEARYKRFVEEQRKKEAEEAAKAQKQRQLYIIIGSGVAGIVVLIIAIQYVGPWVAPK